MSAHEGVSCDACGKSNFRSKRYKCLICFDYDLCSTCYEQGETSSNHASDHAMQCILTRQDFDLYYQGERYASDQAQSLTCPFCGEMGFSIPFINNSSDNPDLFHHLQSKHADEQQSTEIICPICAAMTHGEPNLVTADLLAHIANDHQQQAQQQVQTPSTAGIGSNLYSRQSSSSSTREFDLTSGISTRAGFRRGPLRTPSRRGGLGRGGGIVSQHFLLDSSTSTNGSNDPIADLLSQLSTVRRLAAANNNNSNSNSLSSSSSNPMTLQNLTRQQYERERLRTTGRSQQTSSAVETDLFDSFFASALFIEPISTTNPSQQTWTQIVTQQPPSSTSDQPSTTTTTTSSSSSTNKPSTNEPDPSLLRRLCTDESCCSIPLNNAIIQQQTRRNDFVHSLLFTSFVSSLDHHKE